MEKQQRLGPYRIEHSLGRGGMGEVFQGFDERLDRPVALKRIKSREVDTERRKRFQREARAVARIHHSAIVQVHDWVEDAEGAWIVMELVEGRSVRQLLNRGVALASSIEWAIQIAEGLGVAHRAGVVHRDLKPENIMISDAGEVKILDFGLAKRSPHHGQDTTLTDAGTIIGTFTAMSPEQALGRPVDHRSDLFSLGSLIYEMVTGASPFRGSSVTETLARICTQKQMPAHELDSAVPVDLSRLIDNLLNKDPALRPADASAVEKALKAIHVEVKRRAPEDSDVPARDPGVAGPTVADTRAFTIFESADEVPVVASSRPKLAVRTTLSVLALLGLAGLFAMWSPGTAKGPDSKTRSKAWDLEPAAEVSLAGLGEHELYVQAIQLLRRYDKKDNIDRSIDVLQRLLAKNPDSAPGHAALALAYGYLSRTESKDPDWLRKAEAIAERAVELDPFLARGLLSRGFIHRLLGRSDEASSDLKAALELDPELVEARLELARVQAGKADLEATEAILTEGAQRHPESWTLQLELGILFYRTARYEAARDAFERVVARVPDNAIGWRNLSATHYSMGDLAKASTVLQRAIEIEPKSTLYSNLGTYYFAQGLYSQAVQAFERVISLAGGANDYLMWANLADAYRWTPDNAEKAAQAYGRALQLLAEELEARRDDGLLRTRLALYLAKKGDCDQSLKELRGLEGLPQIDGAGHYRRAVALEICGQREPAIKALSISLQAGYPTTDARSDPELLRLREDPGYHRLLVDL